MNANDQITATSLLLRWFEAYQDRHLVVNAAPGPAGTKLSREMSGLQAASRAFLGSQNQAWCSGCGYAHAPGSHHEAGR